MSGGEGVLSGRVAWVTGGAAGIGAAISAALTRAGATVAVLDLQEPTGPVARAVRCDISDEPSVDAAAAELIADLGAPGILVNNAGINLRGAVPELSSAEWDRVLRVNLYGAFYVTRRALPGMLEAGWGRVVSISSGTAVRVQSGRAAYAASKAGLIAFTKVVAAEGAVRGVTANVVAPGITDTPLTRAAIGGEEELARVARESPIANPMQVVLSPADIAEAVLHFAGPASRHTTGQVLHVSAGSVMG